MTRVIFTVPDMECPNCAMHLEGLEDEIAGVISINASYRKFSMEVEFDPQKTSVEAIIFAANGIGYHPQLVSKKS